RGVGKLARDQGAGPDAQRGESAAPGRRGGDAQLGRGGARSHRDAREREAAEVDGRVAGAEVRIEEERHARGERDLRLLVEVLPGGDPDPGPADRVEPEPQDAGARVIALAG